jgi:tetratricopeptide (TPR) repeat protein
MVRSDPRAPVVLERLPSQVVDDDFSELQLLSLRAGYHAVRGEIGPLLELRRQMLQRSTQLHGNVHEAYFYPVTTPALAAAGQVNLARDDLRAFADLMPPGPYRDYHVRYLEGCIEAAVGNLGGARSILRAALPLALDPPARSLYWGAYCEVHLGEVALALGDLDGAGEALERGVARACRPELRLTTAEALGRRALAELALAHGDVVRAAQQLELARELATRMQNPLHLAHADRVAARLALASGQPGQAEALGRAAELAFTALGQHRAAQRLQALRGGTPWLAEPVQTVPHAASADDTTDTVTD